MIFTYSILFKYYGHPKCRDIFLTIPSKNSNYILTINPGHRVELQMVATYQGYIEQDGAGAGI